MRRLILAAAVCLPGCVLPYAAPTLSYVPPYDLECPVSEVHAFRINITRERKDMGAIERCELKEIAPDAPMKSPSQTSVGCTHGFYVAGVALNFPVSTSHTIAVRLYRPGYETVEVNSWDAPGKVIWKPALTTAAQEMALDDLFDLGVEAKKAAFLLHRQLEAGAKSAAHREALRFGAAEYAHLAGTVVGQDPTQRALRDRLVEKARRLEQLAEGR
jgi:hypothetical protein